MFSAAGGFHVGALIIRMGFWGVYYTITRRRSPPKWYRQLLRPYISCFGVLGVLGCGLLFGWFGVEVHAALRFCNGGYVG